MDGPLDIPLILRYSMKHFSFKHYCCIIAVCFWLFWIVCLYAIFFEDKKQIMHSIAFFFCQKSGNCCAFNTLKVHIFWEGHKILLLTGPTLYKSKVKILQNFVAFSEYINFKTIHLFSFPCFSGSLVFFSLESSHNTWHQVTKG